MLLKCMPTPRPKPDKPSAARAAMMRAVKAYDTAPERIVRALLRDIAPGYRLQRRGLPGRPDIVYGNRRIAIFVHGCFWHGHSCPRGAREPKTNADYWRGKIAANRARDARNLAALDGLGWHALIVWECELKDSAAVSARLRAALAPDE